MTNDLISRQAAIDALNGKLEITGRTNAEAVKGYIRLVKDRLERLPSAQPELVRCKDCVEFRRWDDECGECYDGLADGAMVRADGYCYAAERKSDGIQK